MTTKETPTVACVGCGADVTRPSPKGHVTCGEARCKAFARKIRKFRRVGKPAPDFATFGQQGVRVAGRRKPRTYVIDGEEAAEWIFTDEGPGTKLEHLDWVNRNPRLRHGSEQRWSERQNRLRQRIDQVLR